MVLLLLSQAQFDTQRVTDKHDLGSIDDVLHRLLSNSVGDFRICYSKNDSIIFGRDIFGRKSLCGRLHKRGSGDLEIEIATGFLNERCTDCFEFPPGAIYLLNGLSDVRHTETSIFFKFDHVSSAPLTVYTYYSLNAGHPFHSPFANKLQVHERESADYLQPSSDFDLHPTEAEIEVMADAFIKHLSEAIKSVFEPNCLIDTSANGPPNQLSICFSGGVDSLAVTVLAALSLPFVEQFNLINTTFGETEQDCNAGSDRQKALECFDFLTQRFGSRFSMILVNVLRDEVAENRSKIECAMLPCFTVLDESLASVMWFGSRGQGKQIFPPGHVGLEFKPSNCALVGSGADELFGGYARHRTTFNQGGWSKLHSELQMEISRIGARNFGRDDRIALSNGVHLLAPFMSDNFVRWATKIPLPYRVDFKQPRGLGEKQLLRTALRRLGFPSSLTDTPKKAMQFGSGYAKLENRGKKGGDISISC